MHVNNWLLFWVNMIEDERSKFKVKTDNFTTLTDQGLTNIPAPPSFPLILNIIISIKGGGW